MPTTHHPDPQPTPKRHSINARRFSIPLANSMNASEEELPPFPTPEISTLRLDHKPSAKLHYTYYPSSTPNGHSNPFSQTLIVFLNGLMSTRSSWDLSISSFLEKRIAGRLPYPSILSYDRYGQGESERDPSDRGEEGHDATVAVHDLKQVILQIWRDHLDQNKPTHFPSLIFVCNSIGCALARLFAQANPGTVSGLLFLDSIMANSDGQDIWPDPDGPEFSEHTLPDGVSVQELRETRRKYKEVFGPEVMSKEGLSRRNLRQLLPESDRPRVEGYLGKGPVLTVVGHDWETFAEQSLTGSLRIPKLLTMTYANPAWRRYNEGLTHITDPGRAIGPITAVNCGHFIQIDGPGFVSDELVSLLDRVVNRVEQVSERG